MSEKKLLITVDMLVYNHEKYLRQAIESVLMQQGNFEIELLIHDDASPDNSQEIIRSYQAKYPNIIKPILQKENQLSKGVPILATFEFPRYSGDYVAFCEGDDYWTDPKKIQKQIDFLESHPDYVAVGHNVIIVDENGDACTKRSLEHWTSSPDYEFTLKDTDKHRIFGQTASRFFRNIWKERPEIIEWVSQTHHPHGDTIMSLIATCLGRVWVMKDVMSAYRYVTHGTSYSARVKGTNQAKRKVLGLSELILLAKKLGKTLHFRNEYEKTLFIAISCQLRNPTEKNREILSFVWERYPYKATAPWAIIKQVLIAFFLHWVN